MIITIKTLKYAEMEMFYRDKLNIGKLQGEFKQGRIWFRDFGTEIHLEEAQDQNDVGVYGKSPLLILYSQDVAGVAEMYQKQGLPVKLIQKQSATEAFLHDPDGNIVVIKAKDSKS